MPADQHLIEPSAVLARFFIRPAKNQAASIAEDRPVFENREYVEILYPGDRLQAPVFPADAQAPSDDGSPITYKEKYRASYEAFLRDAEALDGTPLHNLGLDKARIAELHALNIKTLEHLAGLPETAWRKLGPGGDALIEQARAILDRARNGRSASEIAQENALLKAELDMLRAERAGVEDDPYEGMTDDDLKTAIKDKTGQGVRGQPSRATLIRMMEG